MMLRKIITLSVLFLFIYASTADAQRWRTRRYMAYIGAGTANYYGDIGGALTEENWYGLKDIDIEFTRPSLATGIKYKIDHRWNARLNVAAAYLQGSDNNALNGDVRLGGGYHFTSIVLEPSAMAEFYIIPESRSMVSQAIYNRKGMVNGFRSINLYAFAGAGAFFSFPEVTYLDNGNKVVDFGGVDDGFQATAEEYANGYVYEHQNMRTGMAIPFGIGAQMSLTVYWTINLEFGRRYTILSDYVDGYTSRYSTATDVYDFLNVIFSYKIRTNKEGWPVIFRRMGTIN